MLLAIGDIHNMNSISSLNDKFKSLILKQNYVLCPGNIGSKQNKMWLDGLSKQKLVAVKGEEDSDALKLNDTSVIKVGKIKIGLINGYQLKPNCDH